MKYKVLLTTSGTGSRLEELTKNTNKALVEINGKPTIEYIFNSYPEDIIFVVTLGYLGDQVKDFLEKNYPNRKFEFVWVDKYVGEGSSLLYSMRSARENLQCPFIFHACDTIVTEKIPEPNEDWVIGYVVDPQNTTMDIKQYRSHKVKDGYLSKLNDKGVTDFDSIHIGMTGVNSYNKFWEVVEELYSADPNNQALGDVPVIEKMIEKGITFKWIPIKVWLDTGNLKALKETEEFLK
jgi:NDP-sugar pyrophosphorylase family protein